MIDISNCIFIGTIDEIRNVMNQENIDLTTCDQLLSSQIYNENTGNLFQKMLTIQFPKSFMKLIKSQYFLTEIQGLWLVIEYLKFHILNHMFPENWVPSASIREFFYEHVWYRMHFDWLWQNVFQVPGSKWNINKWSEGIVYFNL